MIIGKILIIYCMFKNFSTDSSLPLYCKWYYYIWHHSLPGKILPQFFVKNIFFAQILPKMEHHNIQNRKMGSVWTPFFTMLWFHSWQAEDIQESSDKIIHHLNFCVLNFEEEKTTEMEGGKITKKTSKNFWPFQAIQNIFNLVNLLTPIPPPTNLVWWGGGQKHINHVWPIFLSFG